MNLFHNISVKNGGKINESLLICHGKKRRTQECILSIIISFYNLAT
jgi:hypothetical protein